MIFVIHNIWISVLIIYIPHPRYKEIQYSALLACKHRPHFHHDRVLLMSPHFGAKRQYCTCSHSRGVFGHIGALHTSVNISQTFSYYSTNFANYRNYSCIIKNWGGNGSTDTLRKHLSYHHCCLMGSISCGCNIQSGTAWVCWRVKRDKCDSQCGLSGFFCA